MEKRSLHTDGSNEESHPIMQLSHVVKSYQGRHVVDDVNLTLCEGECVAVIGKNGSGKSTLLKIMAGLLRPTNGERICVDQPLQLGYVTERFQPLPFSPKEYLSSMGKIRGLSKRDVDSAVNPLLDSLGMEVYAGVKMSQFSKGMLQKVNLIQGMMARPKLLLLDEPLSGLDVSSQKVVLRLLTGLKQQGSTIIAAVHESQLIESIADRTVQMTSGKLSPVQPQLREDRQIYGQIAFSGITSSLQMKIMELNGFVQWVEDGPAFSVIHVRSGAVDDALRLILDLGGSVVAVESTTNPDSRLNEWLRQAPTLEGRSS